MTGQITLLTWLWLSAPAPIVADKPATSLDLRGAASLALAQNPSIQVSSELVKEGRALSWLGISRALPSVDGTVRYSRKKDSVNTGTALFDGDPYNYYSAEFRLDQPLLKRGYLDDVFGSRLESTIRLAAHEIAKRTLLISVIQSFYQVCLANQKLEALQKAETIRKQSLETAEHRKKIGRGQLLDVLQARTELALLKPEIEKATNDQKAAAASLAFQLGKRDLHEIEIQGRLSPPPMAVVSEKLKAITVSIPELSKIQAQRKQAEYFNTAKLGKHWPKLAAFASVGRTGFKKDSLVDDASTNWALGLELSVPAFSGMSYWFERQQLEAQEAKLAWEEIQLKDQFVIDQIKAREDLRSAESVITSSRAAAELAAESVKEARRNYRVATIDYLQLLATEQSLLDSEIAYAEARYNYINVLGRYFTACGYPIEVLVDILAEFK